MQCQHETVQFRLSRTANRLGAIGKLYRGTSEPAAWLIVQGVCLWKANERIMGPWVFTEKEKRQSRA